jgi:hypothetical protein
LGTVRGAAKTALDAETLVAALKEGGAKILDWGFRLVDALVVVLK